jgi:hypothetical protein
MIKLKTMSMKIAENHKMRRKSERLGWKCITDKDRRPLSERIGEGQKVGRFCVKSHSLLVP